MEEEEESIEQKLLVACQNGDANTLQDILSSVPGLDVSMATDAEGFTLLMHSIVSAGKVMMSGVLISLSLPPFLPHTFFSPFIPLSISQSLTGGHFLAETIGYDG